MNTYFNRIIRAIKLESHLFEEVEADPNALLPAMGVVILSSLATGIASLSRGVESSLLGGMLGVLIGWFAWSYIIFFIGTRILSEPTTRADYSQLLQTIGFASAPGILGIIGILPFLYTPVILITSVWMLVATVIAVRQALDYKSTGRAIIVSFLGWIIYGLVSWLVRLIIP